MTPRRLCAAVAVALVAAGWLTLRGGHEHARGTPTMHQVPAHHRLTFDLLLRLPGQRQLAAALAAIENPRSRHFAQPIAPATFGRRFGLAPAELGALQRRLAAVGVRVVSGYPQRTMLTVSASAGVVQRLFGVSVDEYRERNGQRVMITRGTPRIPAALARTVAGLTGLDTRRRLVAHDVPLSGLDPQAAAAAYDVAPLHRSGDDGQGQTIAVISFSAYDPADPAAFARAHGLTGPAPRLVAVDGGTTDTSGALEANLDIDVIRAIAPAAQVVVYEAPQSTRAYADAISQIVRRGQAGIISSSWGQCELGLDASERRAEARALTAAVAAGVSMLVATGDFGAYDCQQSDFTNDRLSVDWPASSADAVAVGGTRLDLTPALGYAGEAAWEDQLSGRGGGGGISTGDARPAWQAAPGVIGPWSNGHRQVPDVAADADPGTPWSFYAYGAAGTEGGTSASAPFWAAAMALIGQYAQAHGIAHLGYVNPVLYALAATHQRWPPFHDVVRGGNRHWPARAGWDPATGLGSPDVYNLARDVVAYLRARPAGRRLRPVARSASTARAAIAIRSRAPAVPPPVRSDPPWRG